MSAEVLETAADVMEETLDVLERTATVDLNGTTKGQGYGIIAVAALAGAVVGGGVVYFFTKKAIEKRYAEISRQEILEAKAWYADNAKPLPTDEEIVREEIKEERLSRVAQTLAEAEGYVDYGQMHKKPSDGSEPVISGEKIKESIESRSIWDDHPTTPVDGDAERSPLEPVKEPYLISMEEYLENAPEFEQSVVTWYLGDLVLADESDRIVEDPALILGDDFPRWFASDTEIHVRNEKLEHDFNVLKSEAKYSEEVQGFMHDDDPRSRSRHHERRRAPRKFRDGDDE